MDATAATLDQLRLINTQVNAIPYEAMPGKGEPPDWWTDEPVAGNSWVCRDYTLMKADRLKALGWQEADLTEVFCWTEPPRAYHAVLAVKVGAETYILDSRSPDIYLWTEKPFDYLWDRQQLAGEVEFRDARTGLV